MDDHGGGWVGTHINAVLAGFFVGSVSVLISMLYVWPPVVFFSPGAYRWAWIFDLAWLGAFGLGAVVIYRFDERRPPKKPRDLSDYDRGRSI